MWEHFPDPPNPFLIFFVRPRSSLISTSFELHFVYRLYAYPGGFMGFWDPSRQIRAEKLCNFPVQMRRDLSRRPNSWRKPRRPRILNSGGMVGSYPHAPTPLIAIPTPRCGGYSSLGKLVFRCGNAFSAAETRFPRRKRVFRGGNAFSAAETRFRSGNPEIPPT